MRHPTPPRPTLLAALAVASALLAACGSSRRGTDDRPLCERCHGGTSGNAAPPRAVSGATATSDLGVGAHQAHLVAGRLRGPIPCEECHTVPGDMAEHEAGIAAIAAGTASRVVFGPLGAKGGAGADWSRATGKCANTFCHGATLNHGGTNQQPAWTTVDGSQAACGTCHFQAGDPFPAGHPTGDANCNGCHPESVLADNATINIAGGKHLNGASDGGCTSCHGAPPADRGHQIHAAAAGVASYGDTRFTADLLAPATTTYAFGCGNCHPLDFSAHDVHTTGTPSLVPLLDLSPTGAPAGSLRARNDAAAGYDPIGKTCSGVYCHSTGQASPAFVDSPAWDGPAVPGPARCAGCHGNPPNYASGPAGSATANSHVALRTEGSTDFAVGHFAGLPSVDHEGSAHGGGTGTEFAGDSAAPITCQTCHYRTADPANTGPSGFYYLDTSGTYGVGAAYAGLFFDCIACHDGGGASPAQGVGSAMPFFHVNGTRDVDLDPRTTLTISGGLTLPSGADRPTRPYWYTRATTNNTAGTASPVVSHIASLPGGVLDGTTLSLELSAATWDPSTKSCAGVACHLNAAARSAVQPIQWGEPPGSCDICHGN